MSELRSEDQLLFSYDESCCCEPVEYFLLCCQFNSATAAAAAVATAAAVASAVLVLLLELLSIVCCRLPASLPAFQPAAFKRKFPPVVAIQENQPLYHQEADLQFKRVVSVGGTVRVRER